MHGLKSIIIAMLSAGLLTACASNGTSASYEGYNMANERNQAGESAATMVSPIVNY